MFVYSSKIFVIEFMCLCMCLNFMIVFVARKSHARRYSLSIWINYHTNNKNICFVVVCIGFWLCCSYLAFHLTVARTRLDCHEATRLSVAAFENDYLSVNVCIAVCVCVFFFYSCMCACHCPCRQYLCLLLRTNKYKHIYICMYVRIHLCSLYV